MDVMLARLSSVYLFIAMKKRYRAYDLGRLIDVNTAPMPNASENTGLKPNHGNTNICVPTATV